MEEILLNLQGYIVSSGVWAPLVYVVIMIIAVVISPIPSSPLAILAGAIFGWKWAIFWTLLGALLGAIAAFYIARIFGRPIVEKFVSKEKLGRIEELMPEHKLTLAIFLLRLPPLPFFDAVSYAAGLTKISVWNFTIASFFGLIPLVFAFSYFGDTAINISHIAIVAIVMSILFLGFLKFFFDRKKSKIKKEIQ